MAAISNEPQMNTISRGIFVETRTLACEARANSKVFAGTLVALLERQVKAMYGDPFVSLLVAVVFAIVFYNRSSAPKGESWE